MATTEFGLNHPLARKLWSEKLFRETLKQTWISKFIGSNSSSLIQVLNDTSKQSGDRITFGLRMLLTGAGVAGDSTLEGNEEALNFYADSITINQLRHAVRSAGKMSEQRVPYSMREEARMALTDWYADRLDRAFFSQICGDTSQGDTRYTGMMAPIAPTTAANAADGIGRMLIGNNEGGESSLSAAASHAVSLRDIDRAVARAKTMTPVMRPLRINGDDFYVAFLHPYQVYQLRQQTSSGQWADIQKAALQGGQATNNPLFTGAVGMYNGTIIHEAVRIPNITANPQSGSRTDFRRGAFCGAQAAVIAFGQEGSVNRMDWQEEMFDYGNQLGVAAGMIWALKKVQFQSTDFSTITLSGFAPAQ